MKHVIVMRLLQTAPLAPQLESRGFIMSIVLTYKPANDQLLFGVRHKIQSLRGRLCPLS